MREKVSDLGAMLKKKDMQKQVFQITPLGTATPLGQNKPEPDIKRILLR